MGSPQLFQEGEPTALPSRRTLPSHNSILHGAGGQGTSIGIEGETLYFLGEGLEIIFWEDGTYGFIVKMFFFSESRGKQSADTRTINRESFSLYAWKSY